MPGIRAVAVALVACAGPAPAHASWVDGPLGAEDASWTGVAGGDRAGYAVIGLGDQDGDGRAELAIGAPWADGVELDGYEVPDGGVVYLLAGITAAGGLGQSLAEPTGAIVGAGEGDAFGSALSTVGDLDGDGLPELIVGAPQGGVLEPGRAYLFASSKLYESAKATLSASEATVLYRGWSAGDRTGAAVAGVGDVDGDGVHDFVIGAPEGGFEYQDLGIVYLISGAGMDPGSFWLIPGFPFFTGDAEGDEAGSSLAGGGDLDGDGLGDLVVGAPAASGFDGGAAAGRVYVVPGADGLGGAWNEGVKLGDVAAWSIVGEHAGQLSGEALAVCKDLDGDELGDLVIGAPGDAYGGEEAGAVYVFLGTAEGYPQGTPLSAASAMFSGAAQGARAGATVASLGDVNGDGLYDAGIGAPGSSSGAPEAGAAYLLLGRALTPGSFQPLEDSLVAFHGTVPGATLGWSAGAAGDVDGDGWDDLLLGAPGLSAEAGVDEPGTAALILGYGCRDEDADGVAAAECGGADCDDGDPDVHPGSPEDCADGVDNDCDGAVDGDDPDCEGGDDDDADDDDADDDAGGDGAWGGGGIVCAPGAAGPGGAAAVAVTGLWGVARRRRGR